MQVTEASRAPGIFFEAGLPACLLPTLHMIRMSFLPTVAFFHRLLSWFELSLPSRSVLFLPLLHFHAGSLSCLHNMGGTELQNPGRLAKTGPMAVVSRPMETSSRRYRILGPFQTSLLNLVIVVGWRVGIPVNMLAQIYHSTGIKRLLGSKSTKGQ